MGGFVGLDYAAVAAVLDIEGVTVPSRRRALLQELRLIEAGALEEFSNQGQKERAKNGAAV